MSDCEQPPTKKKRLQPNKKWKDREVQLIIDFLQEEPNLEAPTAQIYYRRFLERSHLEATWELVRWKVRHLKAQFSKANEFLASTGEELLDEYGSNTEAKLSRICPYFHRLKEVFGKQIQKNPPPLMNADAHSLDSEQFSPGYHEVEPDVFICEPTNTESVSCVPSTASPPTIHVQPSSALKTRFSSCTPSTSFAAIQKAIQKERMKLENARFEREKEIDERRLVIEEKRVQIDLEKAKYEQMKNERDREIEERKIIIEEKRLELDLRKAEVDAKIRESEVELKKLELEMRERIAKYEIECKYKK